jgi:Zn-dependent alcohol dehydrogenase
MRAAVCYAFGKPLVVEEIEVDPPRAGEVKVRVEACAICHSDLHVIRGDWGGQTPVVPGHEVAGVVADVGPGVTGVEPGEHVVVSLLRSCGHCFYCTIGRPYNCETQFPLDTESRLRNKEGLRLAHGIKTAGFSEYTVVHKSQVVAVPRDIPSDAASLLACGVITGFGAVSNTASVEAGSSVVVIGVGGVGLNCVQAAAISGAVETIAVDILDNKLQAARSLGATRTINARRQDPVEGVLALTEGRGADYAFAAVGSSSVIAQATQMIRQGGVAVIVGMPPNADAACVLNAHHLTYGRTVMGSQMGSTRLSVDVPRLVTLYQQGRLKLDELITGRYPLDEVNAAIASTAAGEALRNVITF